MKANPRHESNERLVADYIAGMTDRFAIATFERLFVPRSWDSRAGSPASTLLLA